jgi:hypothetical protein
VLLALDIEFTGTKVRFGIMKGQSDGREDHGSR